MDYPFYLYKLGKLPDEVIQECQNLLITECVSKKHPHFVSERNKEAYQMQGTNIVVSKILPYVSEWFTPEMLYWHEINKLSSGGILGEHSDLAYAGYNKAGGYPQEIIFTHKIHVHLNGQSILKFRRSKYEPQREFKPEIGCMYWYNNYVWHESQNPGTDDRYALSLIFHDKSWEIRNKLFSSLNLKFNNCYQI